MTKPPRNKILHFVPQSGQSYMSKRLACERCGLWVHGNPEFNDFWVEYESQLKEAPQEYVRCDAKPGN